MMGVLNMPIDPGSVRWDDEPDLSLVKWDKPKKNVDWLSLAAPEPITKDLSRVLLKSASALPGMFSDAATGIANKFLPEGKRFTTHSSAIDELLGRRGQSSAASIVEDALTAAGGAGASGSLAKYAGGVVAPLGERVGTQMASAGVGSLFGSGAREAGVGPTGQIAATLFGSIAPSALQTAGTGLRFNMTQAGRDTTKGRILNKASGDRRQAVLDALDENRSFIQGERPTVAQAASPAGALTLAGVEKDVSSHVPELMSDRNALNEAARLAALRKIGGTKEGLESAIQIRGDITDPMRELALKKANAGIRAPLQASKITDGLDEAMNRPGAGTNTTLQSALGEIKNLIIRNTDDNGFIDARELYTLRKLGAGNVIEKFAKENQTWDKKFTSGLLKDVQSSIDDAIEGAGGSGWKNYLQTYSKLSERPDQMKFGQSLERSLIDSLSGTEKSRPSAFSNALRTAGEDFKTSSGYEIPLRPDQKGLLSGIQSSLQREALTDTQKSEGMKAARGLLGETFDPLEPPNILHRAITISRDILEKIGVKTKNKTIEELAAVMQEPSVAARLMREATPNQRAEMMRVIKASGTPAAFGLMQPLSQVRE
jgi:hypothetical protein